MSSFNIKDIKGIECKNVTYQAAVDGSLTDLILIKEVVHTNDGKTHPRIRLLKDYKRPVYITKPNWRNHQDKKENEEISKLDKFMTTQVEMPITIQRALGYRNINPKAQLRQVCTNPYVYNADLSPTTILRAAYRKKWPNLVSRNKVAVLDTERDIVYGTDETILVSVTMGRRKVVCAVEWWTKKTTNWEERVREKFREQLSDITLKRKNPETGKDEETHVNLIEERGGELDIYICKNAGDAVAVAFEKTHAMMPDMLAIWNMDYDIPIMIRELEKAGYDIADVFCDPSVPRQYRYAKYIPGKAKRETNSKTMVQHPADLWHRLICMAGFYTIDAMCLFKRVRVGKGNEVNYKLDTILKKYLGIGKLKFKELDHITDMGKWHELMQSKYQVEYTVYNLFDCISVELLDERTNDMGLTIISLAEISDLGIFTSLPKRLVDVLHYFYEEHGRIAGCVGTDAVTEIDENIISLVQWIN